MKVFFHRFSNLGLGVVQLKYQRDKRLTFLIKSVKFFLEFKSRCSTIEIPKG